MAYNSTIHTLVFPFVPGDAVFHLRDVSHRKNALPAFTRGVVLRISPKNAVIVKLETGRTITTYGQSLAYAGYCPTCVRPAIVRREQLVCPQCGGDASSIPPGEIAEVWYPEGHTMRAHIVYEALVNGAPDLDIPREASNNTPLAKARYQAYRDRERRASFNSFLDALVAYLEKQEGESDSLPVQPLPFGWTEAPAVDQEPSRAAEPIDLGDWLQRQMKRAA